MAVIVQNCPLNICIDGIISYLQYIFKTPGSTPEEYRWSANERATKIFITGPFTVSRNKVGALPTVTVMRGDFNFENRAINNLKESKPNTFEDPEYLDIMRGPISIVCEAGTGAEATGLANFIALELQSNRHEIKRQLNFMHRLLRVGISRETPTKEEAEITRWQCSVSLDVSLYSGWISRETGLDAWRKASIFNGVSNWSSIYGEYVQGSDLFIDNSANFGILNDNLPQMLEGELGKKWYFLNLNGDPKQYIVEEIVDSKTLRLSQFDENKNKIPFNPDSSQSGVDYKLLWNNVHISINIEK